MALLHSIITYILNIVIGCIQFKIASTIVESKTSLPRLLLSSFILLTIYSVCVYFINSWVLVPLYVVLFAIIMVLLLGVDLTPGILSAGLVDCFSGVINILVVSGVRVVIPLFVSSKAEAQSSLELNIAKLLALGLWLAIYYLLVIINRKTHLIIPSNESIGYLAVTILFLGIFLYGNINLFTDNSNVVSLEPIIINSALVISFVAYSAYVFAKYMDLTRKKLRAENQLQRNLYLRAELDKLKAFKHSQANTFGIINGLVKKEDLPALRDYMDEITAKFSTVKGVEVLDPYIDDIPILYNLLLQKIFDAEFKNIKIDLSLQHIAGGLRMKVKEGDLAEMLGVYLDNAIEATADCKEKLILLSIVQKERIYISIRNPYVGELDLGELRQEGKSTKEEHTGYGLYQVDRMIRQYEKRKVAIITEYDTSDHYFTVKLRI